ncbi:MAG: prolyl oligopeptidase family serine peptidase [Pseudohongiella sp.]|nr:prolyl oligopeptidase family serine peptidase [Pseudohongiella sp.]
MSEAYLRNFTVTSVNLKITALLFLVFTINSNTFLHAQSHSEAPPISTENFFKFNVIDNIKISPDGEHLAMVFSDTNDVFMRIVNIDSGALVASFTTRTGTGIADFNWATNERILFSTHQFMGGLETPMLTGEIFGLNIDNTRKFQMVGPGVGDYAAFMLENLIPDTGNRVRVTRYEVSRNSIARSRPSSFLLDINNRPPSGSSAMMRNLLNEVRSPLPWGELHSDQTGTVRLATSVDDNMMQQVRWRDGSGRWQDISADFIQSVYDGNFEFAGFSGENDDFYFLQRSAHGTVGLYRYQVAQRSLQEVFAHPQFDLTRNDLVISTTRDAILGAKFSGYGFEVHYFSDHPEVELQQGLDAAYPGELVRMTSMSHDGRRSIVAVAGPQRAGDFFLLDNHARQMIFVGSINAELPVDQMAPVTPFGIRSPDGLILSGYLTKPADADAPLPLVIIPHGGPIGMRDNFFLNREAQYLAHHGYAVLQINFRGSGGFGKEHLQKGFGEWGRGMIDDINMARRWAIQSGHADAGRVCIYGASYGAFAALASAAQHPDDYHCAVGYAGIYNLNTLSESDIPFVPGGASYIATAVGSDAEELRSQSPVNQATQIKAPVFLAHGGQDKRAPPAQAEAMRRALQQAGNEPRWLYQSTEGHGFYNKEYRTDFYNQLLDFIDQHIGD